MKKILLLGLMVFAIPAYAYEDSNGQTYAATTNEHGATLTSTDETIYLGNSCDALSDKNEHGEWAWANDGFIIEFPGRRIGFPLQEHPVLGGENCRM